MFALNSHGKNFWNLTNLGTLSIFTDKIYDGELFYENASLVQFDEMPTEVHFGYIMSISNNTDKLKTYVESLKDDYKNEIWFCVILGLIYVNQSLWVEGYELLSVALNKFNK